MSALPPPSGRPVAVFPRPDPWAEQRRRDAEHRAQRRRRRRRWLVPLSVVGAGGLVVAIAVGVVFVGSDADDPQATQSSPAAPNEPTTVVPDMTVPAEQFIVVDEVWLIDRGDEVYDWGVTVTTPRFAPRRSGVVIDVRLLDADGMVVERGSGIVDGIDAESTGGVAGRLIEPVSVPTRIEFDVSIGVSSNDRSLDETLVVRGLERVGDDVRGRVRSNAPAPVSDVTMLLVWRNDAGEIVATMLQPIERLRPGVDARFEIDVSGQGLPDGRPDDIVWVS